MRSSDQKCSGKAKAPEFRGFDSEALASLMSKAKRDLRITNYELRSIARAIRSRRSIDRDCLRQTEVDHRL